MPSVTSNTSGTYSHIRFQGKCSTTSSTKTTPFAPRLPNNIQQRTFGQPIDTTLFDENPFAVLARLDDNESSVGTRPPSPSPQRPHRVHKRGKRGGRKRRKKAGGPLLSEDRCAGLNVTSGVEVTSIDSRPNKSLDRQLVKWEDMLHSAVTSPSPGPSWATDAVTPVSCVNIKDAPRKGLGHCNPALTTRASGPNDIVSRIIARLGTESDLEAVVPDPFDLDISRLHEIQAHNLQPTLRNHDLLKLNFSRPHSSARLRDDRMFIKRRSRFMTVASSVQEPGWRLFTGYDHNRRPYYGYGPHWPLEDHTPPLGHRQPPIGTGRPLRQAVLTHKVCDSPMHSSDGGSPRSDRGEYPDGPYGEHASITGVAGGPTPEVPRGKDDMTEYESEPTDLGEDFEFMSHEFIPRSRDVEVRSEADESDGDHSFIAVDAFDIESLSSSSASSTPPESPNLAGVKTFPTP